MAVTTIKIRRDTIANWESVNPVLNEGEPSYDKDNKIIKIGDGTNNWRDLPTIPHSSTDGLLSTEGQVIQNMVVISQSAYSSLSAKDINTLYYVIPNIELSLTTEAGDVLTTETSDTITS